MSKKVLLTGATGMTGGILLELCLDSSEVKEVVSLVRKKTNQQHSKLTEIVLDDFTDYTSIESLLPDLDVVFYCLGVYTGAVPTDAFKKITVQYPFELAKTVVKYSPQASFCLLSGQGADRTEKSKLLFARYKGEIENKLSQIGFESFYTFRPGYIYPVTPRKEPNFVYRVSRLLYPLIKLMGKKYSLTSVQLASAMFSVGMNGFSKEILENQDILSVLRH